MVILSFTIKDIGDDDNKNYVNAKNNVSNNNDVNNNNNNNVKKTGWGW